MSAFTQTPEYRAWVAMIQRCYNPANKNYDRYGGRGISVCREWLDCSTAFLRNMGKRPSKGHSLDRFPNNDGNYEPGNVRWATRSEQQENSSQYKHAITFCGRTLGVRAWSAITGIPATTIVYRIKAGKGADEILSRAKYLKGRALLIHRNIESTIPKRSAIWGSLMKLRRSFPCAFLRT